MKLRLITAIIIIVIAQIQATAETCTVPSHNNNTSGDNFYGAWTCSQVYIDQFWYHFDFDKGDWDDGFGYDDPCNLSLPLAKTFNALYLLAYSAEDYARRTDDFSGNALRWAYPYCATVARQLDARCGDGSAFASSSSGGIKLFLGFFYTLSVSERAGTIVHESRHQGGKSHNGGTGCPRGVSCDTNWAYEGANMFHVLYLWWFAVDGTRTTTAMKNLARNRATAVHNSAFNTNPGFNI